MGARFRVTTETDAADETVVEGGELDAIEPAIRKFTETVLATIVASDDTCIRLYDNGALIGQWDHGTEG